MRARIGWAFLVAAAVSTANAQEFQPLPRGTSVSWFVPASYDLHKVLGQRAPGYNGSETPAGWWVWDRATGTFAVVPEQPGVTQIDSLTAISGDGTTVVGGLYDMTTGDTHACRYTIGQSVQDLGTLPDTAYSMIFASNVDGSILGGQSGATDLLRAVEWTSGGGMVVFPASFAGDTARITGISSNGSVMVGYSGVEFVQYQPWRWTAATGVVNLPMEQDNTLPSVSANGAWIVCRSGGEPESQTSYRWSVAGGKQNLPLPAGAQSVAGWGISDDGNVVVGYSLAGGQPHPWVWRSGYGSILLDRALASRLPPGTLNGWEMFALVAVSRDGTLALGKGTFNGVETAFIVEVPPACGADLGSPGGITGVDGVLDNNDFIAFINLFFAEDPRADVGTAGGLEGSDGHWDNNDFIQFIALYFGGC